MKNFLYLFFAYYAVRCDDASNSYYVIEMPENDPMPAKPFHVYWNVPTMQCRSKNIPFDNLYEKYGIIQNDKDNFRGEKITILYEPGFFPALFKNESSGKYRFRNGGVPQEGDLQEHLRIFKRDIEEIIPDRNFDGVGIIDFESWRPVFRQNFGTLVPYKDVSYEVERKLHPWWPKGWVQSEAKRRFEESARQFMQTTLSVAKQMRPNAIWGYYGFPHCFNMASNNMNEKCSNDVNKENDNIYWLWAESTALLPSIYRARDLSSSQLSAMVRGRVAEAARLMRRKTEILPYFWFRYRDDGFITEGDLSAIFSTLYKSDASGFIIWGSSNDVNTVDKCLKLREYVGKTLGPAIAAYTKQSNILHDEIPEITTDKNDNGEEIIDTTVIINKREQLNSSDSDESSTNSYTQVDDVIGHKIDPEMIWIPPANYSDDISRSVEEELMKKGHNGTSTGDMEQKVKNINESIILSIIMDLVANSRHEFEVSPIRKETNSSNRKDVEKINYMVDVLKMKTQLDEAMGTEDGMYRTNNDTSSSEDSSINYESILPDTDAVALDNTDNIKYDSTTKESNFNSGITSSETPEVSLRTDSYRKDLPAKNIDGLVFIKNNKEEKDRQDNKLIYNGSVSDDISESTLSGDMDTTAETVSQTNLKSKTFTDIEEISTTPSYDTSSNLSDEIVKFIYNY